MLILSACLFVTGMHASGHLHHASKAQHVIYPPEQVVWSGYGGNAQHTAISQYSPSGYGEIAWSASQDATNEDNVIHYGSSSLTSKTIIYPFRMLNGDFQFVAKGTTLGGQVWSYNTDFQFPPSGYGWIPPVSGTLLPDGTYVGPRIAGGVFSRPNSDQPLQTVASYYPCGAAALNANFAAYSQNVFIVTPITADASGSVYYGIQTFGAVPDGMSNCYVKMTEKGQFTVYECGAGLEPSYNAAPALSNDGKTLYAAVTATDGSSAYLLSLNTATMTKTANVPGVLLVDPSNGLNAETISESTASPLVGPDGDVYYGVMGNPFYDHGDRGFLLHFDSNLNPKGVPGAFGWDDTPSIVPSSSVPAYAGTAKYLLFCKYNNYASAGGQGNNMVAVLDPTTSIIEPTYGLTVMKPVYTVLGVTPDPTFDQAYPGAVREWCINSAAVDVNGKSVVVNSEDGYVYKLDLTTGQLSSRIRITGGASEAYTSTIVAQDGTVFAVSAARIYAIRAKVSGIHSASPAASVASKNRR